MSQLACMNTNCAYLGLMMSDLQYCTGCGRRMIGKIVHCPSCAGEVRPGWRFCGHCGTVALDRDDREAVESTDSGGKQDGMRW